MKPYVLLIALLVPLAAASDAGKPERCATRTLRCKMPTFSAVPNGTNAYFLRCTGACCTAMATPSVSSLVCSPSCLPERPCAKQIACMRMPVHAGKYMKHGGCIR